MSTAGYAGYPRRERVLALAGLLAVTALAWLYLWLEAGRMGAMPAGMAEMRAPPWDIGTLALTFVMWSVMMVGMMLPSAAPAILLYGAMVRKNREAGTALPALWIFVAGYLTVWTGFSLAATLLQAGLAAGGLLTPAMSAASAWLSGGLLIVAGLYQWSPAKAACLRKCRAPLQFFLVRWRSGAAGAVRMGAEHGLYCVGCCWALMLLLFAAGVMNLLWVALIAGFVFVEKLLPLARSVGRWTGTALIAAGGIVILAGA